MSLSQRRAKLMRIVEGLAVGLVVLDAVAYFALIRPLRSMRAAEEDRYMAARSRVRELRSRVTRLETFQGAVPDAESHLAAFLQDHVASRRQRFSETAQDLVVVRNFTLEPTEQGESALRLAADLYLKP